MFLRSFLAATLLATSLFSYAEETKKTDVTTARTQAFTEAEKMLGTVPTMLRLMPDSAVPGAWAELKNFQLGQTELSGRTKELIGLAVSAQIPCRYCLYFHSKAAMELGQATEADTKEAIAIAALVRHWSTFFNGLKQDEPSFNRELDRMFKATMRQSNQPTSKATESGATTSATDAATTMPLPPLVATPEDVYRDAKKMWGFVPMFISKFPRQAIAGAWNEYNGVMLNPDTKISEKERSLIALAVAAQIPCGYCISMDKRSAKSMGASETEINEAIAMASATRHWSTILNGSMTDEKQFRSETDSIIAFVKKASAKGTTSGTTQSPEETTAPTE